MPIHITPFSRRNFLRRALLAGAAAALTPSLSAAMRRTDADSWALLADTHIAGDATDVQRNVNMTDHFKQVTQEILGLPERAAGVFVLGDCALSSGKPEEYEQLTRLLKTFRHEGSPVHLALGNHDHRENFYSALKSQHDGRGIVADKHVGIVESRFVNWLMLDSLEKTLQTPGSLGGDQLEWLARTLDANPKKPAVILVHHNPGEDGKIIGLKDTTAFFDVIRPRRQVKAWFFGHTHNWNVARDESGIHLVNLPPVAYIFREGNPSGWLHATARRDGMRLELRSIDPSNKAHGQIVELSWREV